MRIEEFCFSVRREKDALQISTFFSLSLWLRIEKEMLLHDRIECRFNRVSC